MTNDQKAITKTAQYEQWARLGLICDHVDNGESYLSWTSKAFAFSDTFTLKTLFDAVLGKPHPDLDRRLWKNFDKDGFALVDEED